MAENDLTDLMKVVREVPPLHTPYVPLNSIVREFVGGSCYEYYMVRSSPTGCEICCYPCLFREEK